MAEIFSPSPVSMYLCSVIGAINNVLNEWSWETNVSYCSQIEDTVDFCVYQFKVDYVYISLYGDISASEQDILKQSESMHFG